MSTLRTIEWDIVTVFKLSNLEISKHIIFLKMVKHKYLFICYILLSLWTV